ncbi:MAG TPA: ABC transporter substrate-binding protein [Methylomirabilota bacterium]|nr:ABC transporter substrate-binding protein [Methylomirabilota bacterium]
MMDRRAFLSTLAGGLLTRPRAAEAQPERRRPRIGLLLVNTPLVDMVGPQPKAANARAFIDGMRNLGWIDGQNITIERRSGEGKGVDRLREMVREMVSLEVDLVVVNSAWAPEIVKVESRGTMPLVVVSGSSDALIRGGHVASVARPGGTVTGVMFSPGPEIFAKHLQLLKEAAPRISRVALLFTPPFSPSGLREVERALKLTIIPVAVATPDALDNAFAAIKQHRVDAIILGSSPFFFGHRHKIIDFAASQRLPTVYWWRPFTDSGGLLSYGADWVDLLRRAATYVDKILKGAKPGDLPIEQPTKFELIINLKTAKALGLTIPPALLARADEVIR